MSTEEAPHLPTAALEHAAAELGTVTLTRRQWRALRAFMAASVLQAVLLAAVGIWLIDTVGRVNDYARDTRTAQDAGRAARIASQARLSAAQRRFDAELRELACLLVVRTPDNGKDPAIHKYRLKYGCPPYSPARARNPFSTTARPRSYGSSSPAPSLSRAPAGATVTAAARTATVTATPSPSTPHPVPSSLSPTSPRPLRTIGCILLRTPRCSASP